MRLRGLVLVLVLVLRTVRAAVREFARDLGGARRDRGGVDHAAFVENRDHREEPALVIAALRIIRQRLDAAAQFVDDEMRAVRSRGIGERPHQRVDAHLPRRERVLLEGNRMAIGSAADVVLHRSTFARGSVATRFRAGPLTRIKERRVVKIAVSSSSFARAIAARELTQLEWLDVCANELEADAVVFDAAHFPHTDDEYLAQLKKLAVDLGLAVAGVAAEALFDSGGASWLAVAKRLGAPLAIARAPQATDDAGAWAAFADVVKTRAREAKKRNVTLAIPNVRETLCASTSDLKRIAKDVDSAWLRYAIDPLAAGARDGTASLLGKSVIVRAEIADLARFATPDDRAATDLIAALARFRGCVLLETTDRGAARDAFHDALRRFADVRARTLAVA